MSPYALGVGFFGFGERYGVDAEDQEVCTGVNSDKVSRLPHDGHPIGMGCDLAAMALVHIQQHFRTIDLDHIGDSWPAAHQGCSSSAATGSSLLSSPAIARKNLRARSV
jgi:hypothetical protein